uniref:Uncharacterized protein n=1 Tax=Tetraselmis sp. GSL018 TaxID=582737 RepID=A0A061RXI7_9CHLO
MPSSRPYVADQAVFDVMHDYAYRFDLQTVLNHMLSDTFKDRPDDPITYWKEWLDKEGRKHINTCKEPSPPKDEAS